MRGKAVAAEAEARDALRCGRPGCPCMQPAPWRRWDFAERVVRLGDERDDEQPDVQLSLDGGQEVRR